MPTPPRPPPPRLASPPPSAGKSLEVTQNPARPNSRGIRSPSSRQGLSSAHTGREHSPNRALVVHAWRSRGRLRPDEAPRFSRPELVAPALRLQRRGQFEQREQSGAERRDLGNRSTLDAQDVELERAELGVAGTPEVACGGRHAVGHRRDEPPVAVPVDAAGAVE